MYFLFLSIKKQLIKATSLTVLLGFSLNAYASGSCLRALNDYKGSVEFIGASYIMKASVLHRVHGAAYKLNLGPPSIDGVAHENLLGEISEYEQYVQYGLAAAKVNKLNEFHSHLLSNFRGLEIQFKNLNELSQKEQIEAFSGAKRAAANIRSTIAYEMTKLSEGEISIAKRISESFEHSDLWFAAAISGLLDDKTNNYFQTFNGRKSTINTAKEFIVILKLINFDFNKFKSELTDSRVSELVHLLEDIAES